MIKPFPGTKHTSTAKWRKTAFQSFKREGRINRTENSGKHNILDISQTNKNFYFETCMMEVAQNCFQLDLRTAPFR